MLKNLTFDQIGINLTINLTLQMKILKNISIFSLVFELKMVTVKSIFNFYFILPNIVIYLFLFGCFAATFTLI